MHIDRWIDWTRTQLGAGDREFLVAALTPEQSAHLSEHDWVWAEGTGVLWIEPGGALRRARFTHGAYFETRRGEFYVDSEGSARALPDQDEARPVEAA